MGFFGVNVYAALVNGEVVFSGQECAKVRIPVGDDTLREETVHLRPFSYNGLPAEVAREKIREQLLSETEPEELLGMSQVVELSGISMPTIWRYRKKGMFPEPALFTGYRLLWRRSDVEGWLAKRPKFDSRGKTAENPAHEVPMGA